MTVSELEETYQQLRDRMLRGELDEEEFKAEVEHLRLEDDLGNQWKIGWYTGKWYRFDQGQWVQGQPQEPQASAPRPPAEEDASDTGTRRKRRSFTPCLVVALIGFLVLASLGLIFGWNPDRWGKPTETVPAVAAGTATKAASPLASETAMATAPAGASPTLVSRLTFTPSRTASPTSTPSPLPSPSTTPGPTLNPTQTSPPAPTAKPSMVPSTVPTTKPKPTPTPSLAGRILFPVYDASPDRRTFDIYAVDLATGKREIMIGQASQPALSRNGKRLAYRSWNTVERGILVRELTNGNSWVWISYHEAEHPSWSPDSQNLVFSSQQESDRNWRLYRTFGLDIDRVRREGGDVYGRVPAWSADGRIVYWECPIDKCGIYAIHPDGTSLERLTASEDDTSPAVSPDGGKVAFMSNVNDNWEIYVTSTHPSPGQEPKRLTLNAARDGLPAWSPDGRWLAFATDRNGAWAIWVMRPDGTDQRKLFDVGGSLEGMVSAVPVQEQHGWTWESLVWSP